MTCAEFKELARAYALDSLDADERAACDAHLASNQSHEGCAPALREANELVSMLALAQAAIRPNPETWAAIERALPPIAAPVRRAVTWMGWAVAAAALVVVMWAIRDRNHARTELQGAVARRAHDEAERTRCAANLARANSDLAQERDALELLQRPGTRLVALAAQGDSTSTANVILQPDARKAFVVGRGLRAPTGKDYELWIIRGDQKIPAGLLHGNDTGALLTAIDPKLLAGAPPDAIAVTLEATGGATSPQGPIVLVGKI